MNKQTSTPEVIEDELVGNVELLERQITYLLTIKSYCENQLNQIEESLENAKKKIHELGLPKKD